jgi:hypothetical protein
MIALTCSTIFKFFLTTFLYSRIVSAKWTFLSVAFFCKIQLSQNVETHFRSTIKNFSTNIVSKSKNVLMSKVRMRFLRFFQSIIQVSIWFLNTRRNDVNWVGFWQNKLNSSWVELRRVFAGWVMSWCGFFFDANSSSALKA